MGIYDDDDDDDVLEQPKDNNVLRDLRKALKAEQAKNKTYAEQLEQLTKAQRSRTVSDVLKDKGLKSPEKVAKLIPSDIEPTSEAVSKWLDDFADVFGLEAAADATPRVPSDDIDALRKMDAASNAALGKSGAADIAAKIAAAQSPEELAALFRGLAG